MVTAAFLILFAGAPAPAGPSRHTVHLRMEMVESPVDGPQLDRAEVASQVGAGKTESWCFVYGRVRPGPSGGWEAVDARAGAAAGACDEAFPLPPPPRPVPYLLVDVRVRHGAVGGPAPLALTLSRRKVSGFGADARPSYARSEEKRALPARGADSVAIPLIIAERAENDAFRVLDVLLRFRATPFAVRGATAYGAIAVRSDTPRAHIVLDGGIVGRTVEGTATLLRNVRAGDRELRVRDLSGRETGSRVRVVAERTAEVTLNLKKPPSPVGGNGLVPLGANAQGYEEYWRTKDGAPVVRIPAGAFLMGSQAGEGEPPEHPQRTVHVSAYLIDKTEVTWGQYARFSKATGTPLPETPLWGTPDDYPVTSVTWPEAAAFCAWADGRLPTEAEWEKAARGTDGRRYPWGEDWDPDRCNTRDGGPHRPRGVGTFPSCVSPYGALDMVGGVWEFCQDWYDPGYYATAPTRDPQGPASGQLRVHRGGSWLEANLSTRPAFRHGTDPTWRNPRHGFRCAQDVTGDMLPGAAAGTPRPEARALRTVTVFAEMVPLAGQGRAAGACTASWELAPGAKAAFRGSFGRARPDAQPPWKPAGADARCDQGGTPGEIPYLAADVSLTLLSSSGARHDLAAMVTVRKLTGFSPAGQAIYTDAVQHRTFSLEPGDAGIVPLLLADATEGGDLGVDHVSLYVGVRDDTEAAARYGAISLRAGAAGADVFLDGGRVARLPEDDILTLWNVPAGDTEVSLRDAAGREARRLVTVRADRRVLVAPDSAGSPAAQPNALAPIGTNHRGYEEYRRERDGAVMVRVPAGEFLMGNLETEGRPAPHAVYVSAFLMDKDPATWARYQRFLEASGRPLPPHEPYWGILTDHPAVFVTWEESRAYCEWAGGRLPTEAEREKAARGTDTRKYPWGDSEPSPELAIFRRNWGSAATAAVGGRPAGESPYGLRDMAGNVWEWCEDWYDPRYYEASPRDDPRGPATGTARVVRGGSWDSRPSVLSCSARNFGYRGYREGDFGFRCAADAP